MCTAGSPTRPQCVPRPREGHLWGPLLDPSVPHKRPDCSCFCPFWCPQLLHGLPLPWAVGLFLEGGSSPTSRTGEDPRPTLHHPVSRVPRVAYVCQHRRVSELVSIVFFRILSSPGPNELGDISPETTFLPLKIKFWTIRYVCREKLSLGGGVKHGEEAQMPSPSCTE